MTLKKVVITFSFFNFTNWNWNNIFNLFGCSKFNFTL